MFKTIISLRKRLNLILSLLAKMCLDAKNWMKSSRKTKIVPHTIPLLTEVWRQLPVLLALPAMSWESPTKGLSIYIYGVARLHRSPLL